MSALDSQVGGSHRKREMALPQTDNAIKKEAWR